MRQCSSLFAMWRPSFNELIRSGELPVVRLGRVVRVPRDALRLWIEAQSSGDDAAATSPADPAP